MAAGPLDRPRAPQLPLNHLKFCTTFAYSLSCVHPCFSSSLGSGASADDGARDDPEPARAELTIGHAKQPQRSLIKRAAAVATAAVAATAVIAALSPPSRARPSCDTEWAPRPAAACMNSVPGPDATDLPRARLSRRYLAAAWHRSRLPSLRVPELGILQNLYHFGGRWDRRTRPPRAHSMPHLSHGVC